MISKSCPKTIEQVELDERGKVLAKECYCDTDKCNGGALTTDPPTKKCVFHADCENSEDCGEGGYCRRSW